MSPPLVWPLRVQHKPQDERIDTATANSAFACLKRRVIAISSRARTMRHGPVREALVALAAIVHRQRRLQTRLAREAARATAAVKTYVADRLSRGERTDVLPL